MGDSKKLKVAFVGGGNMAGALVAGLAKTGQTHLVVAEPREDRRLELRQRFGVSVTADNAEAVQKADVIVLAVKPQALEQVLADLAHATPNSALVVSIAAGKTLEGIERALSDGTRAIRAMPNTPALVGKGITALAAGKHATDADLEVVRHLFERVGEVVVVEETQMDAVTALSGSGPAYIFAVIEALTEAGRAHGLGPATAELLAIHTVLGAGQLAAAGEHSPQELRERVTSPGGTTEAGLAKLREEGLAETLAKAVAAAAARARELAKG